AAYPNIYPAYRKAKPEMQGIQQIRKKGLRDQGATLIADAAHRIAVGAETMALRVDRTCSNALALARTLAAQPKVARVYYPGLPQHPQHATTIIGASIPVTIIAALAALLLLKRPRVQD
ncbi:PLP-dependent transferase, partial [Bradyrhizobium sp. BRP14]|nr:PLP-dependent transferase [Bradyrhizobium sp. BRP14]